VRAATKQWLFLILLAATLAVLIALALWQMAKARREAPARPERSRAAPVGRTPLPSPKA
jgi:cytochrome oxidase assembly protein ShyY1